MGDGKARVRDPAGTRAVILEVAKTGGTPATVTITLTDAGNVPEEVSLAANLPSGLTASTLTPVSLEVGQSMTETVTLTPSTLVPLNSMLDATITATFGPSSAPQTQTLQISVSVAVPGVAAIASAAIAAGELVNINLSDRLNDLSAALTALAAAKLVPVRMTSVPPAVVPVPTLRPVTAGAEAVTQL